jgi:hypothetical protein
MYSIDASLRVLLAACLLCIGFILFENRRMRKCVLYGASSDAFLQKREPFTTPSPSTTNRMKNAKFTPVDGSQLENYDFQDIEKALEKITEKMESMRDTSMKFIEARDLANVVRADLVSTVSKQ